MPIVRCLNVMSLFPRMPTDTFTASFRIPSHRAEPGRARRPSLSSTMSLASTGASAAYKLPWLTVSKHRPLPSDTPP